jgi:hypothetical protein
MKAAKDRRVRLSVPACAIIEDLKGATDSGFLLLGAKAKSPLSNTTMLMALRRRNRSDDNAWIPLDLQGLGSCV